jgi:hypothetical protein
MVALLADGAVGPKDVIAPVAAVCGAAIAAFVAWFNARQTAADRLQSLIAMYKNWPEKLGGQEHVAALIRGQLGEIWHRYPHLGMPGASGPESAEIEAAGKRHLYLDAAVFSSSVLVIGLSVWTLWPLDKTEDMIVVSLIGGFASVVAVTSGLRIVRHFV